MKTRDFNLVGLLALLIITLAGVCYGKTINDDKFGFSLEVPDEFKEMTIPAEDEDTLYNFSLPSPSEEAMGTVMHIQRMGGVIQVGMKIEVSDLAEIENGTAALSSISWRGNPLQIVEVLFEVAGRGQLQFYSTQFPLSGEAVQLQVGGPVGDKEKLREYFDGMVSSFKNHHPLHEKKIAIVTPIDEKPEGVGRTQKVLQGMGQLVLTIAIIGYILDRIRRSFKGKTREGPPESDRKTDQDEAGKIVGSSAFKGQMEKSRAALKSLQEDKPDDRPPKP
ncbi:hypothetical protein ACFL4W_02360 [Planctomycetota bacterium]